MKGLRRILFETGRAPRAAFGLAAAALVAALAWPIDPGPPPPHPAAMAAEVADETALRRPLFDPGRRAWTARGERAALIAGDPPRPVLTVRGILIDGDAARALIDEGGAQTWLARGEGHGDWRITAITRDRVTLTQGERQYTADFLGPSATLRPIGARPAPDADAPPVLRR